FGIIFVFFPNPFAGFIIPFWILMIGTDHVGGKTTEVVEIGFPIGHVLDQIIARMVNNLTTIGQRIPNEATPDGSPVFLLQNSKQEFVVFGIIVIGFGKGDLVGRVLG